MRCGYMQKIKLPWQLGGGREPHCVHSLTGDLYVLIICENRVSVKKKKERKKEIIYFFPHKTWISKKQFNALKTK